MKIRITIEVNGPDEMRALEHAEMLAASGNLRETLEDLGAEKGHTFEVVDVVVRDVTDDVDARDTSDT